MEPFEQNKRVARPLSARSQKPSPTLWLTGLAMVIGGMILVYALTDSDGEENTLVQGPDSGAAIIAIAADASAPPPPLVRLNEGKLENGQSVADALRAQGLSDGQVAQIVNALKGHYDFRRARPGTRYIVEQDPESLAVQRFEFHHDRLEAYRVTADENGALVGSRMEIPTRIQVTQVGAEIEGSLYQTMQRVGESAALVSAVAEAFAWDIDFNQDTQPKDRFKIIVEKIFVEDDFIRYGKILAAEYAGKLGQFRTFWFQPPGKDGAYYLEDGKSAAKTFLATPLKFSRVSSGFSRNRKHPVLGYTKAHLGVDYAAPTGTPVRAMASGRVTYAGWKGPNGKLVRIDHGNGLQSAYAHLHRISRGIKRGAKVKQKQVIGQVGSTGRSTGPHLHFAVKKNGRFVNPQRLKMSRGKGVPSAHRKAYQKLVKQRRGELDAIPTQAQR